MARLPMVDPAATRGKTKELLSEVKKRFGMYPNLTRALANSDAALEGFLAFSGALGQGELSPALREQIAITVAEANACEYCLSAHTAIGKMVGLDAEEVAANRSARSADPKVEAALRFAHEVVVRRGQLDADDLERLRAAGYADGEIAEIVANVALNLFTNYFNHIVQTEVDFPRVRTQVAA